MESRRPFPSMTQRMPSRRARTSIRTTSTRTCSSIQSFRAAGARTPPQEPRSPGTRPGERPCCFCVRNPRADPDVLHPTGGFESTGHDQHYQPFADRAKLAGPHDGIWYGGTPAYKTPMDNYIATDRLVQQRIFDQLDRIERGDVDETPRQSFPGHDREQHFCCDGGPAPGDHTWTCWGWLGVSFG